MAVLSDPISDFLTRLKNASLAGNEFRAKSVFVLATILAAGSYVAFVWALKLQFPVWPSFISG